MKERGKQMANKKAAGIRYAHTNIVARDWEALSRFYIRVFGCRRKPPARDLKGPWLDDATSLKRAHIRGIHLVLPGYDVNGPTLEIFQYSRSMKGKPAAVNSPGFAHIAFAVRNVPRTLGKVERYGGRRVGQIVSTEIDGVGRIEFVYARDPEGNIVELQKWE
jgi:predicted enzyme related to lactoylglutathione lyase